MVTAEIEKLLITDYGINSAKISPLGTGRINDSYLVTAGSNRYVLQRLHKMFGRSLLQDIVAVTKHLADKNLPTPILIKNVRGELGSITSGGIWRMMTFVPGSTIDNGITPKLAYEAAKLVGRFHQALIDFDYQFQYTIPGFHDTPRIMQQLQATLVRYRSSEKYRRLNPLAVEILDAYQAVSRTWAKLPKRITHGDLKLNNLRFDEQREKGVCLLDLDTMGRLPVALDLGDAARSWCYQVDRLADQKSEFNIEIYQQMLEGYLISASFLTSEELLSFPAGLKTITLELSARLIIDAFEEYYFKLDSYAFENLTEQNLYKAQVQLGLFRSIKASEPDIQQKIAVLRRNLVR